MASGTTKNILLFSFDDAVAFWKYKTLFGAELKTPNLDRICAQSTAFHSAYCQAPIFGPSRASFMSGQSPHQSGVLNREQDVFVRIPPEEMWPYLLKQHGYYSGSAGKVHHGGFKPLPQDKHEIIYSDQPQEFRLDWRLPERIRMEFGGYRNGYATVDPKYDKRFYDYQSATSAIEFLQTHDSKTPFYRGVGFFGPHGPYITPRAYKEMYKEKAFKAPAEWEAGFARSPFMDQHAPENLKTERWKHWKKSVRNYFSALTHTDHHLGRVWDALKASPHADNTVVIIISDHGLHLGERRRMRKTTLWEQVANVPLIIHDPDIPQAQVVTDPVALLDVAPTVMDYVGLPAGTNWLGRSLRPMLQGERDPDRAVPTFLDNSSAIRKGKYRFIRYEDGTTQFFDLEADWWQTTDLGPDHPDYAAMRAAHDACCHEHGFDPDSVAVAAQ